MHPSAFSQRTQAGPCSVIHDCLDLKVCADDSSISIRIKAQILSTISRYRILMEIKVVFLKSLGPFPADL
jgi:hypothetical protein